MKKIDQLKKKKLGKGNGQHFNFYNNLISWFTRPESNLLNLIECACQPDSAVGSVVFWLWLLIFFFYLMSATISHAAITILDACLSVSLGVRLSISHVRDINSCIHLRIVID